ncbi:MAG: zinc-dependent peptidase, partial [Actinobacteria bacterium]|nr:zinc-dependent peptidase [Actinomycetota bacterium]
MLFRTKRRRRRRELFDAGFTDAWRELCAARFAWWDDLGAGERNRLEAVALGLIAGADWEPANGFTLTEEMQVLIAVQAALLAANLPYEDPYQDVHAIVVHPTTVVLRGEHSQVDGLVSDDPMPILGQAEYHGPVLVAWDEVADDVVHHGDGRNVVFHEFAHKLDMLDGTVDGTPPMGPELAGR